MKLRRPSGNDVYLDTQLFTGFMFLTSAMCAWSLRSLKVMKVDYEITEKLRRESSDDSGEPIEQKIVDPGRMSKRWVVELIRGLIARKRV